VSDWLVPIVVAFLTGPVVVLLRRLDRRNTDQHGENLKAMQRVENKLDDVQGRVTEIGDHLTDHLSWHLDRDQ